MKTFYRLLRYEYGQLFPGLLLIVAAMAAFTLGALYFRLNNLYSSSVHPRYEDLYVQINGPFFFLAAYIFLLLLFAHTIRQMKQNGKSLYTFLTLPVNRVAIYWSKYCAFAISMLVLLVAQFAIYAVGYSIMLGKISNHSGGRYIMDNGFFLSLIRSDFIRLLFPFGWLQLLNFISMFLFSITVIYYIMLMLQSTKRWSLLLAVVAGLLMYRIVNHIADSNTFYYDQKSVINDSFYLLLLTVLLVIISLRIVKKGAHS